ncbi:MAG: CHASE2 domain-containing protein [Verrucomicrobia bacterium]|nr:CHASE2 domain-containing protein [Verrucomicrobiota bacterium]
MKSVDLRKQYRGEIPQNFEENALDRIQVEENKTVPRIPKLIYVNFDEDTMTRDEVGERPWDRAFFRDTCLTLFEKAGVRAIGFDFGFTPKSTSRMVPQENSYRSDKALGELIKKYPDRVVLGCLYSGVKTPYVKEIEANALPPLFSEGFSVNEDNFHYPESSSYPIINYLADKYYGRMGSFSFLPYRSVDDVKRWATLWYPAGGKAHAYNLLGGKKSVVGLELPLENKAKIELTKLELEQLNLGKSSLEEKIKQHSLSLGNLKESEHALVNKITELTKYKSEITILNEEIATLESTLVAAPNIGAVIKPQIDERINRRVQIFRELNLKLEAESNEEVLTKDEIEQELAELNEVIGNFKKTLEANPDFSSTIQPQINLRMDRINFLNLELAKLNEPLTDKEINETLNLSSRSLSRCRNQLKEISSQLNDAQQKLHDDTNLLSQKESEIIINENTLGKLRGEVQTELLESNNSLRLVYLRSESDPRDGELIYSKPNEVPLFRQAPIFTLAVETLLAYYGVDHEQVKISEDNSLLTIYSLDGSVLVEAPLENGQWVEVNYFSTWTEFSPVDELIRSAKKKYGSGDMLGYLNLVPSIIRQTLQLVDGLEPAQDNNGLIEDIKKLGVEDDLIKIAQKLFAEPNTGSKEVPSYDELLKLLEGINYYFIPTSLNSKFNPMCGMSDILNYGSFEVQVSAKIKELQEALKKGESKLSQVNSALLEDPENEDYLNFKNKVTILNQNNQSLLVQQEEEMARINSFFEIFKDSIVLIGPTDQTFKDVAPTPFDTFPVPSVSAHGNTIKTLTNQKFLYRLPINTDHLATLGVCVLMALLAVYQGKRASLVQAGGIVVLLGYVYLGFETFAQSHIVWPITAPACAGLSTSFIGLAAMVVIEQKAKGRLKGMFGSYVSSDLVEQMVASGEEPSLGGEETEITAFFSDVQAFSSFSELLTPTGLVDLMNEYLTAMTNILQEERGTLDKYIGDAIVAMYGAPIPMKDHAYQAVRTSILMQQKQIELRKKWVPEVEKWGKCHGLVTQMQTRIGCNTGTATVGNMGALDRFNYTMMGDMVNLAARCESGAKAYGAYIMVTEETKLSSEKTKDDIAFRYLDKIVVKGRSQPVAMYEPTGFMSELTQETQDCLDCFQQGIDKYLAQDWTGALNLFEKAKEMEPNKPGVTPGVKDNPSMILIDRCKVMMENPPGDDWDGVYVMTTK